jgi:hypothetical protein
MLLLLACAPSAGTPVTDDTGAPPHAGEASRGGCSVEITIAVGGAYHETCTATYDAPGRPLTYDCVDVEGYVSQASGAYDEAGCRIYDLLHFTSADLEYRDERDVTCDGRLNSVTEIGAYETSDGGGGASDAGSYDWSYTNTYSGDLLVERVREDGANSTQTVYSYNSDDLLEAEHTGPEDGSIQSEVFYFYDDVGNLVRSESDSAYSNSTWDGTYDALARVVRSVSWADYDDRTITRVTEWEGDSLREAHEDLDNDGDGSLETTLDYAWTCP